MNYVMLLKHNRKLLQRLNHILNNLFTMTKELRFISISNNWRIHPDYDNN
jgi:hypothetical protein